MCSPLRTKESLNTIAYNTRIASLVLSFRPHSMDAEGHDVLANLLASGTRFLFNLKILALEEVCHEDLIDFFQRDSEKTLFFFNSNG